MQLPRDLDARVQAAVRHSDIDPEYCRMARRRLDSESGPLFAPPVSNTAPPTFSRPQPSRPLPTSRWVAPDVYAADAKELDAHRAKQSRMTL
jgi:hypothetical protein